MLLPSFENFPQAPYYPIDAFPSHPMYPSAVLTTDRTNEAALTHLAAIHGPKLIVPEVWRDLLPNCGILISSALSGGSFLQRVEDAARAAPKRCWLYLEPLQTEFGLPCPDGQGRRVTIIDYGYSFYSKPLCCRYRHFYGSGQGSVVLWDTKETLQTKMKLAQEAGFLGYVCLDTTENKHSL